MPLKDFSDLYPALTGRLRQARSQGRIAHGYLFVGDMGSRMEEFANAFMQVCICTELTTEGDACGTCRNCVGVANRTYPYLSELKPKSKSRQIVIDEIRELEHDLHLTSGGETRLAVIYDADRMNEKAQNAFLKTLEEPAAKTIIILVTHSPGNLLATIRSRCQRIALLDNRVRYDAFLSSGLFDCLAGLRTGAGALRAAGTSQVIRDALKGIKSKFDDEADVALREVKVAGRELEPDIVKKREAEVKARFEALYRGERGIYLSALQAWFAQELMRAEGVSNDVLPHPEFLSAVTTPPVPETPRDARTTMDLVEELIFSLQFNVDENLAIEDFCQSVCAKV